MQIPVKHYDRIISLTTFGGCLVGTLYSGEFVGSFDGKKIEHHDNKLYLVTWINKEKE